MAIQTFPLSFAQQRLWFLEQLNARAAAYNLLRAVRIQGYLDAEALKQTIETIANRHEALRTFFVAQSGEPSQSVKLEAKVELPLTDLSHFREEQRLKEAERLAGEEARKAFDLSAAPLFRLRLLKFEPHNHVLVLVMHHIITDGWSMAVFFREMATIYRHFAHSQAVELPELSIQYPDFASWQRESASSEVFAQHLKYWRDKLNGGRHFLELPADRKRPPVQSHRGASKYLKIDTELTEALKCLSQLEGATLFMTLLAALQVLLWRYTCAEDFLIGTPVAGRTELEVENLIGLFVNIIVMRADLSGNPAFVDLLRRVRANALEAFDHLSTPIERIVEDLAPTRSLSHSPLFQVMFVLQNGPKQVIELSGLKIQELEFASGLSKFDLTLEIVEQDGGLYCTFEYNADIFEDATIDRWMGHFENVLRSVVECPTAQIADLEILGHAERDQILEQWNNTHTAFDRNATLQSLFEHQVETIPDRTALIDGSNVIAFRELNERANRIAHHLISKKLDRQLPIGVLVERSIDMVVALLAVLKAGHSYVAIDSTHPKQRIAFIVEDSGAAAVLTHHGLKALLPDGVDAVRMDGDRGSIDQCPISNPSVPNSEDPIAYIMYTSGSTGRPKGVQGTHRALVNRFEWMWRRYPFQHDEMACQKTNLGFVDSIWEIFGPLLKGISNVIIPDDIILQPERMVDLLAAHRVTRIVLVPSLLRILIDQIPGLLKRLPELKIWTTSGEALPIELANRFLETASGATLLNLYGSSEVAADVTFEEVKDLEKLPSVPVGRPIDNVQIYILDPYRKPAPIGVTGEIYVGGDCLARGYHGQPALTAERFIPNTFVADETERLYKTGDLGRYLADGRIEYMGRSDHQVKLRGFRIELGEIESILNTHPLVREAVVAVNGEKGETQWLVAYIVGMQDGGPGASELRRYLKSRILDYMIPSVFVPIQKVSLLPNGKVNRRALPQIEWVEGAAEHETVPPRNEIETQLVSMWQDLLGRYPIGVNSSFFELGGHSLLGMQLLARIRKVFEVEVPVQRLFEEPTIAGLATEIEKIRATGVGLLAPALSRQSRVSQAHALAAELDKLSPDEIETLLQKILRDKQKDIADFN